MRFKDYYTDSITYNMVVKSYDKITQQITSNIEELLEKFELMNEFLIYIKAVEK